MKTGVLSKQHIELLKSYNLELSDFSYATTKQYKPGETIVQELYPIDSIMFVVSGKAKIYLSSGDGEDVILAYYISSGIVGDAELMSGSTIATTTMIAVTDFVCISLPLKHYATTLKNDVKFLNRIGAELANKLTKSSKTVVMHSLYSTEQRLCAYIVKTEKNGCFSETLTDVSKAIGSSYRNMLRAIKRLCDKKIIEKLNGKYKVVDRNALLKIAPETLYEL